MNIRLETENDFFVVENLTREAFWNIYKPGCSEHYVLHEFRDNPDFIRELDLVLEDELNGKTQIIAHVMFATAKLIRQDGIVIQICTFGPISVDPKLQRKGYGKKLLLTALEKAEKMGYGAVCITGNIDVYGTCGFVIASSKNIRYAEDPESDVPYFLLKELKPNFLEDWLSGMIATFKEPSGYFVNENDVEEFDKHFPIKQKLKLPGQLFS